MFSGCGASDSNRRLLKQLGSVSVCSFYVYLRITEISETIMYSTYVIGSLCPLLET